MKEIKDLRKLELSDLNKELVESRKKLLELTMKLNLNELKQTHLVKPLRRYIAVLNTLITEKSI
ncbi:50S ribosomal protein L29 [Candidatus Gracilibacteria bacterium]|nr:50S ribosomal protein L29 [Candidatus Gracilibacteria bacterium]